MSDVQTVYVSSDNIIEVSGVRNVATGSYINSATVTLTLVDAGDGQEVGGQAWPLTLSYVLGTDGNYRGIISDDAELSHTQTLVAKITVDGGAGLKRYWELPCVSMIDKTW